MNTSIDQVTDSEILSVFDDKHYASLAKANHDNYVNNNPYPHIVIDNFLPEKIAKTLIADYPTVETFDASWKYHDNQNTRRYFLDDATKFKFRLRLFATAVNSRSFLSFLETISGIEALYGDPYFIGGGAMLTGTGGFLNIHADFNFHHKLQSWRRLNALFYLTPNWNKDWGGDLELWTTDGKQKVKSVEPVFNRLVVFTTTSKTFHGQPEPLKCPDDVFRRVFSAFYYASKKDEESENDPHFTKYNVQQSPYSAKILEDYKNS